MKKFRIPLLLLMIVIFGSVQNAMHSTSVNPAEIKNYTKSTNSKIKTQPMSPLQLINLLNTKLNFTSSPKEGC
jgi:hypothetical protein